MKLSSCIAAMENKGFGGTQKSSLSKKASQSLRRKAQIKLNPFSAGAHPRVASLAPYGAIHLLYLAENTSQAASVEFARYKRANYARGRLQKTVEKPHRGFSTAERGLCVLQRPLGLDHS